MSPVIRPFETSDLVAAGQLLAERHVRHRGAFPFLPPQYEEPQTAQAEIAAVWESDGASGAVALDGSEVVGYLLGAPKSSAVWGANIWVEAAGQAVREAETMRDLYGLAAARWVDEGRNAHYTVTPSDDAALIDAWFRLSFGSQHAHAVRPVASTPVQSRTGVTVRRAERSDIDILAELDLALPHHQGLSPVFSAGPTPSFEEARADWDESFDDKEFAYFAAEYAGRVVGSAVGCPLEKSSTHLGPARPVNAGFLGFAAVFPEARGHGVGRALGEEVLRWSADEEFDCVVTDWRVTNLLSSRTWPRLGFEQTFHRLHRVVGY